MRKNNLKYHWYGDTYTEKDILKGAEDVSSRQKLMELAQEEEPSPSINWDKWDELVQQTKQDIEKELKEYNKPQYTNKVFVFCLRRNRVIKTFQNPKQAADYYNISRETVTNYMREHRPYFKLMIEFRNNI
jgi:predicted GTPase